MNVAAAAAFSDVHLSDKKDTDDFSLRGRISASVCLQQQRGSELEKTVPVHKLLMVESRYKAGSRD